MSDKEFWLMIRRALLMICKAIERKYPAKEDVLETGRSVSVAFLADE